MVFGTHPTRVSVVPNASRVRGTLLAVRPNVSGRGYLWDIAVEQTFDVEGLPNFVAPQVGKTIHAYVHPRLRSPVHTGEALEARIAFRGDERGGRFVLVEDDVRPI